MVRRKFSNVYETILNQDGPMAVLEKMNNDTIFSKDIRVFGWENNGGSSYDHLLIKSVNLYLFEELNITEAMISEQLDNRPNIIKNSTQYITIHDTASAREGSGAVAHMKYVTGGGGGTSWHYSIGNDGIFHHIPNNEVAFHAGDGSRIYELHDSKIKATTPTPIITINDKGYFIINNQLSELAAYNLEDNINKIHTINDMGIEVQIGDNGNYYLGNTWFSNTYKYICNGGGNRNSIGIESCIDKNSDIYLTWQRLAKLVAFLLEEQSLDLDAVVQHHFFSGKDCPKTMRHANMWNHFLDLVEVEYFIRTKMKDYQINLISNCDYILPNGRIITNYPNMDLSYTIEITTPNKEILKKEFFIKK